MIRGAASPRKVATAAAVASAAVLAGMLPGTPSVASGPEDAVEIAYSCAFTTATASDGTPPPAVTEDATVTVQQTYPKTGAVGESIRPGALTVEVKLDKDAAAAVLPAGTVSVTATSALTAQVTQGSSTADAKWPGLRAAAAPATDGLDLTFTGDATALSVTAPGTLRFDAGQLDLALYAQAGTEPPADSGTPSQDDTTEPDTTSADGSSDATPDPGATGPDGVVGGATATCTPKDGQATALGEVEVAATGGSTGDGSGSGSPTAQDGRPGDSPSNTPTDSADGTSLVPHGSIQLAEPPHSGISDCPPALTSEPDQDYLDSVPRPPTAFHIPIALEDRLPECTFITGLSNVGKLNGAATINALDARPALTQVTQVGTWFGMTDGVTYFEIDNVARMDLPPAHSAFLTFGFMPTTATMTMTQVGPLTLVIVGSSGGYYTTTTTAVGKLDLRLSDVKVNGTPLDVGPHCHTVRPLDLELTGLDESQAEGHDGTVKPSDYNEISGGPLFQEKLTIPPFTGCSAHGDNVDALLTASISGPDNSLNLIQGPLCIPVAEMNCTPEIPYPTPPHR